MPESLKVESPSLAAGEAAELPSRLGIARPLLRASASRCFFARAGN